MTAKKSTARADVKTMGATFVAGERAPKKKARRATTLLPCPFCGHRPKVLPSEWDELFYYFISCEAFSCGVRPRTQLFFARSGAVSVWNTRKP